MKFELPDLLFKKRNNIVYLSCKTQLLFVLYCDGND